jgi:hypothetical protein
MSSVALLSGGKAALTDVFAAVVLVDFLCIGRLALAFLNSGDSFLAWSLDWDVTTWAKASAPLSSA